MDTTIKLKALKSELNQLFLERETLIDLYLSCMISGYSIFVGGLPGTGKTALAKIITEAFQGKSCYRLLQASSTLEEVIGAVDLGALDKGLFRRKLDNGAVMADTLILDEGFKANSPVLNALLGLILDKQYENGDDGTVKSPLNMTVICSNELPQDESLMAFWDRFLVRYWVYELCRNDRLTLMKRRAGSLPTPKIKTKFDKKELSELKELSSKIEIGDDILNAIVDITYHLRNENNIIISDRRHEQIIDVIKAYTVVLGKDECDDECLDILKHICWDEPNQIDKVSQALAKFGNPLTVKSKQFYEMCLSIFKKVEGFDNIKSDSFRTHAQNSKNKIVEKIDILESEINKTKSKSKNKTAKDNLQKMKGLAVAIDEMMYQSFNGLTINVSAR